MRQFINSTGVMCDAPPDHPTIIADIEDGTIVWSVKGSSHRVRYCLSLQVYRNSESAARCFASCVKHYAQCRGLLD